MNEQSSGNRAPQGQNGAHSGRRHHHNRKRHHQHPHSQTGAQAQTPGPSSNQTGGGHRRRRPHHNRHRGPNQGIHAGPQTSSNIINIEKIYEKYLNLLEQHLIARRKFHDLFYRADPAQKAKIERNFYSTLNDVREFESRLDPSAKEAFNKRNNGLKIDSTYTDNHQIPKEGDIPPSQEFWEDPHFLHSQSIADFSDDTEESVGTYEDYLNYKNQSTN